MLRSERDQDPHMLPATKERARAFPLKHAAAGQTRAALLRHEETSYRPDGFGLQICGEGRTNLLEGRCESLLREGLERLW